MKLDRRIGVSASGGPFVQGSEPTVKISETGPLHNYLRKDGANLVGWDKLITIPSQVVSEVKKILLGQPSDYRSNSIKRPGKTLVIITQMNLERLRIVVESCSAVHLTSDW
jgi:hypothetical protein